MPSNLSRRTLVFLIVSSLILIYVWYHFQTDSVVLTNTSGSENGVLVSGQANGGPLLDEPHTAPGNVVDVGSVHPGAARNEIIAFTNSRPVAIREMVPWSWISDTVNLTFPDEIEVAVTIWILKTPLLSQNMGVSELCTGVAAMWTAERMGVKFSSGGCDIRPIPSGFDPGRFLAFDCNKQTALQTALPPTTGRINMYLVDTVEVNSAYAAGNGTSCGTSDFVAMGKAASARLAIHELGHNFSLLHIDSPGGVVMPGFDAKNIMHSASDTRRYFTEGQLFRAHVTPANLTAQQPGSALNSVYSARVGQPIRNCTADPCPALEKRIWPDP